MTENKKKHSGLALSFLWSLQA